MRGVLQAALLLAMVWLVWAYTTWVTYWMDPERLEVRLLLVAAMLISLALLAPAVPVLPEIALAACAAAVVAAVAAADRRPRPA